MTTKPTPREPTQEMVEWAIEAFRAVFASDDHVASPEAVRAMRFALIASRDAAPDAQQPPAARDGVVDREAVQVELTSRWNADFRRGLGEIAIDLILEHRARAAAEAWTAAIEEAVLACEQTKTDFLSPEYSTGQSLSSFNERFACLQCANAIRALSAPEIRG